MCAHFAVGKNILGCQFALTCWFVLLSRSGFENTSFANCMGALSCGCYSSIGLFDVATTICVDADGLMFSLFSSSYSSSSNCCVIGSSYVLL